MQSLVKAASRIFDARSYVSQKIGFGSPFHEIHIFIVSVLVPERRQRFTLPKAL